MLIRNYGLFWKRDLVFWGYKGVSGHLKGLLSTNRSREPVDFREQQGIYALYDRSFNIVYVGQTGVGDRRPFHRLRDHRDEHLEGRWERFSWFGIRRVKDGELEGEVAKLTKPSISDVLDHVEAVLIAAAEPTSNLQRGRFGRGVERYLQYGDEEEVLTTDEVIWRLYFNSLEEG